MNLFVIAGVLVCLVLRSGEGGVVRCENTETDVSCSKGEEKSDLTIEVVKKEPAKQSAPIFEMAQCQNGSEWESNCHFCRCVNGVAECLKQTLCNIDFMDEPIRCKPNTTFQQDCNTCVCLESGLGLCTLKQCPSSKNRPSPEIKQTAQETIFDPGDSFNTVTHTIEKRSTCKPHERFMNDCNSCKCLADGRSYICTQNECMDKDIGSDVEVFKENEEGVDHVERHTVCKARNIFYIGCNTCRCNYAGTDYNCTNKPCPLPDDVELFHELKDHKGISKSSAVSNKKVVCMANRMFIKDCNTCWCNEDGTSYFCTRKVCVSGTLDGDTDLINETEKTISLKKENQTKVTVCIANRMFIKDCNTCWCNEDGTSFFCTRKVCVQDIEDHSKKTASHVRTARAVPGQDVPTKPLNCDPGSEFRVDCNQCLCDNEGRDYSCTRIDCIALNSETATVTPTRAKREAIDNNNNEQLLPPVSNNTQDTAVECSPGSVFDRDCNVCRCTLDGHHATCTIKKCEKEEERQEKETGGQIAGPTDPGFRCNPGEQFKRDCKDCTCSADGKDVFCTLQICESALSPKMNN